MIQLGRKQIAKKTIVTCSKSISIPMLLFLGQNRERHMQSTCGADVPHGHAPTRDETKTREKRRKHLTDANQQSNNIQPVAKTNNLIKFINTFLFHKTSYHHAY